MPMVLFLHASKLTVMDLGVMAGCSGQASTVFEVWALVSEWGTAPPFFFFVTYFSYHSLRL